MVYVPMLMGYPNAMAPPQFAIGEDGQLQYATQEHLQKFYTGQIPQQNTGKLLDSEGN